MLTEIKNGLFNLYTVTVVRRVALNKIIKNYVRKSHFIILYSEKLKIELLRIKMNFLNTRILLYGTYNVLVDTTIKRIRIKRIFISVLVYYMECNKVDCIFSLIKK